MKPLNYLTDIAVTLIEILLLCVLALVTDHISAILFYASVSLLVMLALIRWTYFFYRESAEPEGASFWEQFRKKRHKYLLWDLRWSQFVIFLLCAWAIVEQVIPKQTELSFCVMVWMAVVLVRDACCYVRWHKADSRKVLRRTLLGVALYASILIFIAWKSHTVNSELWASLAYMVFWLYPTRWVLISPPDKAYEDGGSFLSYCQSKRRNRQLFMMQAIQLFAPAVYLVSHPYGRKVSWGILLGLWFVLYFIAIMLYDMILYLRWSRANAR